MSADPDIFLASDEDVPEQKRLSPQYDRDHGDDDVLMETDQESEAAEPDPDLPCPPKCGGPGVARLVLNTSFVLSWWHVVICPME